MCGSRCGKGLSGLCPFSLGFALGITAALAVLCWSMWLIYHGLPPMMDARGIEPLTWPMAWAMVGWALVKGFIFGFVLALIYDCFICIGKHFCRHKSGACGCGDGQCQCKGDCACRTNKPVDGPRSGV